MRTLKNGRLGISLPASAPGTVHTTAGCVAAHCSPSISLSLYFHQSSADVAHTDKSMQLTSGLGSVTVKSILGMPKEIVHKRILWCLAEWRDFIFMFCLFPGGCKRNISCLQEGEYLQRA